MPELKRFAREFKERVAPAAKKGAVLFGKAAERGARTSFQFLKEKGAPKTKEISVKMWALMREKGAPAMKQVLTEKVAPKMVQAGAFAKNTAFPQMVKASREKIVPAIVAAGRGAIKAGKWVAPRAKNASLTAYEKTREQIIRRQYGGNTVLARVSRASVEATGKPILGLRIANMLVKHNYSQEIAAQMIEAIHNAAKNHPAAKNRLIGREISKHALTLFHEGLRAGMVPDEAYGLAARALMDAQKMGMKFGSKRDVQEFMQKYYKIAQQMRELEPPRMVMR